jgi:hypothetical protein
MLTQAQRRLFFLTGKTCPKGAAIRYSFVEFSLFYRRILNRIFNEDPHIHQPIS